MRRLALAALLALAFPAAAAAHATMEQSTPGFQQELRRAPAVVRLRFDQAVTVFPDSIVVVDATGRRVSRTAAADGDPRALHVPLGRTGRGAYTVRWHVMSADGHVV